MTKRCQSQPRGNNSTVENEAGIPVTMGMAGSVRHSGIGRWLIGYAPMPSPLASRAQPSVDFDFTPPSAFCLVFQRWILALELLRSSPGIRPQVQQDTGSNFSCVQLVHCPPRVENNRSSSACHPMLENQKSREAVFDDGAQGGKKNMPGV
jgi:hypothetical protein